MTIAVLPFNAGPNTKPSLARQFANFACEVARNHAGAEVESANYLAQLDGDPPRFVLVNPSEKLNEPEMVGQLFSNATFQRAMDGLLVQTGDESFQLTYRTFSEGSQQPDATNELSFSKGDLFANLRTYVRAVTELAGKPWKPELDTDEELFGTTNTDAFLNFLDGYDALQYIERTQGAVAPAFTPEAALQALLSAVESDPDWEGPYVATVQLCRMCIGARLGNVDILGQTLTKLTQLVPDDSRAFFALGELFQAVNNPAGAADAYENAARLDPEEPAILTRLGMAQMAMGMPANAERNFRKAITLEDDSKPSMDYLAAVLQQTGRAHEVPGLWKEVIDSNPSNSQAHAKYAIALLGAGRDEDAIRAFDHGLESLQETLVIKRYYAPVLAQRQDFDRAMDFFEDCLDATPTDVPLMLEYAQTLQAAGRSFEVPKILRDVIAANPDPNTKAQTQAWLIELEQPNRIEIVQGANEKMEQGDYEGAMRDLEPMRNWLADYWKMWVLLAAAYNRTSKYMDAEAAAKNALQLFPACEPAYAEAVAALGGQGKNDEAYEIMRYAASTIPGSLSIGINLALAASRAGHKDEARALAKQIREAIGQNEELEPVLQEIEA